MTDELKQDVYPAATLEGTYGSGTAAVDVEKNYYTINSGDIVASSTATGISTYQNNNGNPPYNNNPNGSPTANSAKLYKLNAATSKTGLGITLKVMSGDKIDIFGKSYYFQNNAGDGSGYNLAALDILTALIGSPQGSITAIHGPVSASDINGISGTPIGTFLSGSGRTLTSSTTPRAYINYIILDEQFKYVSGGFSGAGSNGTVKEHHSQLENIAIEKNGYIFIYCSNESPVNVFFDNLQVVHTRGPLLEETHYYPFGLTMVGISSNALNFGNPENKKKYNGIEKIGDFDLQDYDAQYRELDPQIGRWWEIDPETENMEMWSPYVSNYDNPITYNDPLGDWPDWLDNAVEAGKQVLVSVTAAVVGTIDNATGSNIRTSVVQSGAVTPDIEQSWNTGLDVADVGSIVGGAMESSAGTGMMQGAAVATVGTGGLAVEVTAPTAALGAGMSVHGVLVMKNGAANLVSQNGRVNTNGNSKASNNPQHGYGIKDNKTGEVHKYGISGGALKKNGTSQRANSQVNALNKKPGNNYKAEVLKKNMAGRQKGLDWEKGKVKAYKKANPEGKNPPGNKRPQVND